MPSGCNPRCSACFRSISTQTETPSESWLALPAVMKPETSGSLDWRKRGQTFERGPGPIAFIALERDRLLDRLAGLPVIEALGHRGRNDLVLETAGFLRRKRPLLTLERILVLRLARDLVAL